MSATVSIFPNQVTSNAAFSFDTRCSGGVKQYRAAVTTFHRGIKPLLEQGIVTEYESTDETLDVTGIMPAGFTGDSLQTFLKPLIAATTANSCSHPTLQSPGIKLTQMNGYYDLWKAESESHLAGSMFSVPVGRWWFRPSQSHVC